MRKSWGALALILGAVLAAGCQEDSSGGAACPVLCPEQGLTFKDTVLDAVIDLGVTVAGFPVLGTAPSLLVANTFVGPDTLRTVAVVHFDTLVSTFADTSSGGPGAPFTSVDGATVKAAFAAFPEGLDTMFVHGDSVTIQVYDVDTTASIFDPAAIAALIRPDRLIPGAARTIARDSITGTLAIPLPDSLVQRAVLGGQPLVLAFALVSPVDSSAQVRFISSEGGSTPSLEYTGHDGSSNRIVAVDENAHTDGGVALPELADYTVAVQGSPAPDATMLAVGGVPASRSYLRFDLPASIVESTTVVRAVLTFTQVPNSHFLGADSLTIVPLVVRASESITDPAKASVLATGGLVPLPTLTLLPQGSGSRSFEIVPLLRFWKAAAGIDNQRALVLQIANEGFDPRQIYFFSTNAAVPDSLRPRLRLSYIPRASFGLP